jgi:hypothetical protein
MTNEQFDKWLEFLRTTTLHKAVEKYFEAANGEIISARTDGPPSGDEPIAACCLLGAAVLANSNDADLAKRLLACEPSWTDEVVQLNDYEWHGASLKELADHVANMRSRIVDETTPDFPEEWEAQEE